MKKNYNDGAESFGIFLNEQRRKKGINLEQLSEGLCSFSELALIENGKRSVGKALRDRLLHRLGISPDDYDHFVFEEEYIQWKMRQNLLYAVSREKVQDAYRSLGEYRKKYEDGAKNEVERRLERQFCLSMEAQILRIKGEAEEQRLGNIFLEALELTGGVAGSVKGKVYSVQELNLLLEYIHYCRLPDREERYQELLCRMDEMEFDQVSLAKVYPKAVYYLCRDGLLVKGDWGVTERAQAITWCEKAVERLRKAGRLYYLWELLRLLETLLQERAAGQRVVGADKKAEALENQLLEIRKWAGVLEEVYGEFGVPKETRDFCWLYEEKEVYCINKIIKVRRKMLGLTRKNLCENICSEKTLGRLEKGETKAQKVVVRALMERLNLASEFCRTELVTDDPETVEMMEKLRRMIRERENEQADRLMEQLKERISLEISPNRQVWLRCRAINSLYKKSINEEQGIEQMREALACTLPYEAAMQPGEKYLTNEEIGCLHSIMIWNKEKDEEKMRQIAVLEEQYEAREKNGGIACFNNRYEIIMGSIASQWGNMGEYNRSDEISRKIIVANLYQRRAWGIDGEIYNLMWNYEQRTKEGIPYQSQRDSEEDLMHCITYSELFMEEYSENFYKEMWRAKKDR